MEVVFDAFKEFENQGVTIECGVIEKSRKKEMSEAMKKLKESGDKNKIMLVKRLARYYGILNHMGYISTNPNFPNEEDKYGLYILHRYLNSFIDTAKRSITGAMTALANDEKIHPFYKYLMFTHLYHPEELAENIREELNKDEKINPFYKYLYSPEEIDEIVREELRKKREKIKKEADYYFKK